MDGRWLCAHARDDGRSGSDRRASRRTRGAGAAEAGGSGGGHPEQASEQRTAPTRPTVHMDTNVAASTMVPGEARRATQLKDKKAWRRSSTIKALMPKGSGAIYTFPRREEERFGEEGDEGDALFEAAMAKFKAEDFGEQHVQLRVIKQKFGQVRRSQWSCVRVVRW